MDGREAQLRYELENDAQASAVKLAEWDREVQAGSVDLPKTQRFIARIFSQVKAVLDENSKPGVGGHSAKYRAWIRSLPTEVVAVLAIRMVISATQNNRKQREAVLQDLAEPLGRQIVLESCVRSAEAVNPLYMQRIQEQFKRNDTASVSHMRGVLAHAYGKVMHEKLPQMKRSDYMHIGKFGVDACIEAGILEYEHTRGSSGSLVIYRMTPEVKEFLTDFDDRDTLRIVHTEALAMQCPPDEWAGLYGGGYISPKRKAIYNLVTTPKGSKEAYKEIARSVTPEAMPKVFDVANYLQGTAMTLHRPTLEAIKRLWFAGGGVMGVPKKTEPTKPAFPFSEAWKRVDASEREQESFDRWKVQARQYYEALKQWRSLTREISSFFRCTDPEWDRFWSPVYADWRGRWYYSSRVNPQGSDLSRGCIHFADKKPLGITGLFWLKVHLANSLGFDKARAKAKAAWVEARWEAIERALDAPEDSPDVWGTDAPWVAYSAAWELREAYRSGHPAGYATGIPVHMDATCSGLQHFSAMLRDPVGARFVNLEDNGEAEKSDIYTYVAEQALKAIASKRGVSPEQDAIVDFWLKHGVPRKMAKRPVMTYVYGATLLTTAHYVQDNMGEVPEGMKPTAASLLMAQALLEGIEATVPAAARAMRWLQGISSAHGQGGLMCWNTPSGFRVVQHYPQTDSKRVFLKSCGVAVVTVREPNDKTDTLAMRNGMSPNFVHSMDSAHLTLTAKGMQERGLSLMAIHDSFGTHPSDVPQMHGILRQQFARMYEENVLLKFLWEVGEFGEVPMLGDFDVSKVQDSEFFFC